MSDQYTPFENGDMIRKKFTDTRYLILKTYISERTGHATGYRALNISEGGILIIDWVNFMEYIREA